MKAFITIIIMATCALIAYAQQTDTIVCENFATEVFKGVNVTMPQYREINSGSKFLVRYEGVWSEEMTGAFEYAVKMWEEVLPTTLPINIVAKVKTIRGTKKVLSRVTYPTHNFNGNFVSSFATPYTMLKRVVFIEHHRSFKERFNDQITDTKIFNDDDITIEFNKDMLGEFSYSLDGAPQSDKYDFVTVALRDIALGLGFGTNFTANPLENKMIFTNARFTPYESLVMESINSTDPYVAYQNATSGQVTVNLMSEGTIKFGELSVYAPENWENGLSLKYMIPDEENNLTKLLTYDFGKGYIMRDLSGVDWNKLFAAALNWRTETRVGAKGGSIKENGSSNDILPYKGSVTFGLDLNPARGKNSEGHVSSDIYLTDNQTSKTAASISSNILDDYCEPFNLFCPNGPGSTDVRGISLCALLKNGKWDQLYYQFRTMGNTSITLNIDELPLHYSENEYARGTTGGLRYRLSQCSGEYDNIYGVPSFHYKTKYFTRDFTPQKAVIKYSKPFIPEMEEYHNISSQSDEYFIDAMIGIRNIEGTEKIIVEQLEDGEELPFEYDVTDFRDGYFIANLDRECTTQMNVISINKNGSSKSEVITIPPLGYPDKSITFSKNGDLITINGIASRAFESGNLIGCITGIYGNLPYFSFATFKNGAIDISQLSSGYYQLELRHGKNNILGHYRFKK